jgi:hypothetical protein
MERDGHLHGTTYQSIRAVLALSKLCLLEVQPEALKLLHHSAEFLPYVVFLTAPGQAAMRGMATAGQNGGPGVLSSVSSKLRWVPHPVPYSPCTLYPVPYPVPYRPATLDGQNPCLVRRGLAAQLRDPGASLALGKEVRGPRRPPPATQSSRLYKVLYKRLRSVQSRLAKAVTV